MIPRRKAALSLMVRALDALAGDDRAIAAHIAGDKAAGRPDFEAATDAYRDAAEAIVAKWRRKVSPVSVHDWPTYERLLDDLQSQLLALVDREIPRAFRMGYNRRQLDPASQLELAALVDRERNRVMGKLVPFARAIIQGTKQPFDDEDFSIGVQIGVHLEVVDSAGAGMGGGYWSAIFAGLGAAAAAVGPVPVQRLLNPLAAHCATCPPKASEYPSWDAMLAVCGGLPGDGSDQCFSQCRCSLRIFQDGIWRDLVEWL